MLLNFLRVEGTVKMQGIPEGSSMPLFVKCDICPLIYYQACM